LVYKVLFKIQLYGKFATIQNKNLCNFWYVGQLRDISAIKLLANNIRKQRETKKMTMEQLANRANIEYSQVSRIERGLINTSISVIFAIAHALEVAPSDLLLDKTQ